MKTESQQEHRWLQRLVGEWTFEVEATMGPGKPPEQFRGRERVRPLGDLWIIAEGEGEMPGCGGTAKTQMTLGYDPRRQRFVGTWVGSMMTHLWLYDGALDAAGRVLTLDTEGPAMADDGSLAKYQDVIELVSDDLRRLSSRTPDEAGQWHSFMQATYRRQGW